MNNLTEMLKGILEGCVLEIISRRETYGYEITRELNSLGFSEIVEGTVYTILVRLEKNTLVDNVKRPSEIGPARKFYRLNENGKKELHDFWSRWHFITEKLSKLEESHND